MTDSLMDIANYFNAKSEENYIKVGDPKAVSKFIEKIKSNGIVMDELQGILDCDDNLLIVSCAGSGKTTTLLFKLIRDILSGKLTKQIVVNGTIQSVQCNILVTTFLKSGAADLAEKFAEIIEEYNIKGIDRSRVQFRTIHSEVYNALVAMNVQPNIITDGDAIKFVSAACKDLNIHSPFSGKNKDLTAEEKADILSILTYSRNRLDSTRFNHPLMNEYGLTDIELTALMEKFKLLKMSAKVQDFEDLEEYLYDAYGKYPKVVEYVKSRYDFIYLDEFQDTSQLQYAILEPYLRSAKGFVCVADDDQCLKEGTKVQLKNGTSIEIENVKRGDLVLTAVGHGDLSYQMVDNVSKKKVKTELVTIKTETGAVISGTPDHIGFVKSNNKSSDGLIVFGSDNKGKDIYFSKLKDNETLIESLNLVDLHKVSKPETIKKVHLTDTYFDFIYLSKIESGMIVPVVKDGIIVEDTVVEVVREEYDGYVYDISVPNTCNFVANDVVVHNCIYGFRGSDVEIVQKRFIEDYKPVLRQLSVNRRCASEILSPIVSSIEENPDRLPKKLRATKTGGHVEVVVDGGMDFLMKSLEKDLSKSEKVGILGRTNADLLIPALLLELDGFNSFSLSKSVSLTDRIPGQVLGIMEILLHRYNEKFESYFKLFLNKANAYQATKLCEVLSTTPQYSIFTLPLDDIRHSAPDLFSLIRTIRMECKRNPIDAYIYLLEVMEEDVYNGKTIYAQRARDFTYYMRKIIQEHSRLKGLTLEEIYVLFTKTISENLEAKKPKGAERKKNAQGVWVEEKAKKDESFVRITTVHDAKGKQWDNVYIWNDVKGCFPNTVGNRNLTKEEFEEERRVHYIAWTRAVSKLTVFTRSDRLDGFLSECDLSKVSILEMNENKRLTKQNMDKTSAELLGVNKTVDKPIKEKDVIQKYVEKYTGYTYICSKEGSNLDICLVKLGGIDGLREKLSEYHLESYPKDMIEETISQLLEDIVSNL